MTSTARTTRKLPRSRELVTGISGLLHHENGFTEEVSMRRPPDFVHLPAIVAAGGAAALSLDDAASSLFPLSLILARRAWF